MRLKIVLVLTVVGLFVAAPALADTFPDLPGMRAVEKTTSGRAAQMHGAEATEPKADESTPTTQSVINKAVTTSEVKTIRELPGGGSLPIINQVGLTSKRAESNPMPRGLTALAAIGTLLSIGGFVVFRRMLAP
jgi:hypothetical protein